MGLLDWAGNFGPRYDRRYIWHAGLFQEVRFPMCQNWFSVIGQTFDVIGFLIIAFEWYHQFWRDHERRIGELQKAYERQTALYQGEQVPEQDDHIVMCVDV